MANARLTRYQTMRDFTATAEPSGREGTVTASDRRRFVIQKHAASRLHFDLRLEDEGTFRSWAVTRGPSLDPKDRRLAVEVEDHPLDYGDFEGTIPKGQYGGGTVQLWDRGHWIPEAGFEDVARALEVGELKFVLEGERLRGSWVLVRMKGDRNPKRDNWLLIKHRDDAAVDGEGGALAAEDRSIASGRTIAQIAAGKGRKPKPFMRTASRAAPGGRTNKRSAPVASKPAPAKQAGAAKSKARTRPRSRPSSNLSCASWWRSRRAAPAGSMKSSSTAIACSCAPKTVRPRC